MGEKFIWSFIPIGYNLKFEFKFLKAKIPKYNLLPIYKTEIILDNKPYIDLHSIGILINDGFKLSKLSKFTKKNLNGDIIIEYIKNNEWDNIIKYIEDETDAFIDWMKYLSKNLIKIQLKYDKTINNISYCNICLDKGYIECNKCSICSICRDKLRKCDKCNHIYKDNYCYGCDKYMEDFDIDTNTFCSDECEVENGG